MTKHQDEKEPLRHRMKNRRKEMSRKEILDKSHSIKERIEGVSFFEKSNVISTYVAKEAEGEVETKPMIKDWFESKEIIVPYVDGQNLKLSPIKNIDSDLKLGPFDILEPKNEIRIEFPLEEVDIVLVPGLAFDLRGNRLGFGKGYYDRLLSNLQPSTTPIGLAYDFQVLGKIPSKTHDVKLDMIITEKRRIET